MKKLFSFLRRKAVLFFLGGFIIAILIVFSGNKAVKATNTDEFCNSCHVHPHSTNSWKLSTHYDNKRGIVVHCVECHLPTEGFYKFSEKVKTGLRDVYGTIFKDVSELDWEEMSKLEHAVHHTYETSCINCHKNLFPLGLSQKGEEAHYYYENNEESLHCINCHLGVGHYSETTVHAQNVDFGVDKVTDTIYSVAAEIQGFENFTEFIPGTDVSFNMIAIPGGNFSMGSPETEKMRDEDEGPQVEVEVSSFFMAELEVSWDEYLAFFTETSSQGRMSESEINNSKTDAISGPTPPWGAPDQGWGKDKRPAITMSHYAASVYCEWLSKKTGKKYRLPTEAEWEYAARGGTQGPYFFPGSAVDYTKKGIINKIFGVDTAIINSYVIYVENSQSKSAEPDAVLANPFGLKHILGNVSEFCSDYYDNDIFVSYDALVKNPVGPDTGDEFVVKGGAYKSDASDVRCASREASQTAAWLNTDPQMPKSKWWYSDQTHVGFRVVCETE
jgi:formylglycine-generating enzyme required for sulfatase activity/nitrate/TMAO reductase-like tetraheme cytochrome c subunit